MFNPSRDEARRFFFDTWRKHKASETLTDLERMTLAIMLLHPEYQAILDAPERYLEREWLPEDGQTNPFLHLAMHLSIEEQLSIDQPSGILPQPSPIITQRHTVDRLASYGTNQGVQMPASCRVVSVGEHMPCKRLTDPMLQPGNGGRRVVQRQIPL